jgi:hypothetical protein
VDAEKPVIIEYRTGALSGARYVVISASAARSVHPEAEIVGYEDGTPFAAEGRKGKKADKPEEPVDWSQVRTYELMDDGTSREVAE